MGLFRPYERKDSAASSDQIASLTPKGQKAAAKAASRSTVRPAEVLETTPVEAKGPQRKSEPTRSRRQAEAERMEKLHPTLTPKERRRAAARAKDAARSEAFERQESQPERVFARDYLDTRWTVNEFIMPLFILIMAATMATMANVQLSTYILAAMWILIAMVAINMFFIWRGFKKELARRFPNSTPKGLLLYLFNRSIMLRRFRQPAPRIKRGDEI